MEREGFFKRIATRFDEFIRDAGVGASLFFIMVELGYINAKALHNLDDPNGVLNWIPATIGSLAFSMTTVVVMRRSGHMLLKRVLPIFDTALVFLGLNVHTWETMLNYPGHLAQSAFFALFTGFITYSLGMINFEEHVTYERSKQDEIDELNSKHDKELKSLQEKLNTNGIEIGRLKEEKNNLQTKVNSLKSDSEIGESTVSKLRNEINSLQIKLEEKEKYANLLKSEKENLTGEKSVLQEKGENYETKITELQDQLEKQEKELKEMDKFKRYFYMFEKSRIGKKKDANITEIEKQILLEADEYLSTT